MYHLGESTGCLDIILRPDSLLTLALYKLITYLLTYFTLFGVIHYVRPIQLMTTQDASANWYTFGASYFCFETKKEISHHVYLFIRTVR